MTTKARTTKAQRLREKTNFLHQQSRIADINSLKPHPENPNIGNVDEIAASLKEFGQYRPIVVNIRNGFIAAGTHTWLGARRLGWPEVSVVEIDVDEDRHKRIMIADNRISDLRQTDERLLDQILQSLKSDELVGTGYTDLDMEDLHTRVTEALEEGMSTITTLNDERARAELDLRKSKTFDGSPLGEEPDDLSEDVEGDEEAPESAAKRERVSDPIQDAAEDLNGGLVQFKPPDDLVFPGAGELEIPKLNTDLDKLMTFDDIPKNLLAWAGSATKDWENEDQWWLYNWGIDSTSGMKDISKVIISFYCYDEYFDNWWWYPDRYVAKVINSSIKYILTPDFSMDSDVSRAFSIWQLYRNRWLARYFQECGLKLMPHVNWRDGDESFLKKYVLGTLPTNLPCIAMQFQTIDPKEAAGGIETYIKHVQLVLDTLKPKGLLAYHGNQAEELVFPKLNLPCPIFKVKNRLDALGEQAKKRKKKTTI